MKAEQAVYQLSRDYKRYARKMAEMKNNFDRAQEWFNGHEKGHAEGLEKGHAEKLEIARKLKARGRPLSEIVEDTGLSMEDVEKM